MLNIPITKCASVTMTSSDLYFFMFDLEKVGKPLAVPLQRNWDEASFMAL